MKIYYVTDIAMLPNSAQTVHVDQVSSYLVKQGQEVVLYAPYKACFAKSPRNYRAKFVRCPQFVNSGFFQMLLVGRLFFDILRERPQVIYSRHSLLLFVPNLLGIVFRIPVILEVNGKLIEEARKQEQGWLGRLLLHSGIYQKLEQFNFRSASRIITVTKGIKEFVMDTYGVSGERVEVVNNGVNTTFFQPLDTTQARKQIGLDLDAKYVGYLGSFYSWQGLRYVAEAALLMRYQGVKFVLVGGGEDRDYLDDFIKKHWLQDALIIVPPVSRVLVPTYINAFDVCLSVPTKFRGGCTSPFKVYEYLACGKPVIQSDIEEMRDEFHNAVRYVEPESVESLVVGIQELLQSPSKAKSLGEVGRRLVEGERSWEAVAKRVTEICTVVTKTAN